MGERLEEVAQNHFFLPLEIAGYRRMKLQEAKHQRKASILSVGCFYLDLFFFTEQIFGFNRPF